MPSSDVNAATRLAEASWKRDNIFNVLYCTISVKSELSQENDETTTVSPGIVEALLVVMIAIIVIVIVAIVVTIKKRLKR